MPNPTHQPPDPSDFETVACYSCGSDAGTPFITGEDDLTGKPGRFHFVRCTRCGLVYQNPRLNVERIKDYYDDEYIAHRKKTSWGILTPLYSRAMENHDRRKDRLMSKHVKLDRGSEVLDVGCGAGTFLLRLRRLYGSRITGVDFKDLSSLPGFDQLEFHCGLFYGRDWGDRRFDLITMWHFLEHDYDPMRTLRLAGSLLKPEGRLVIEVPRLDCLSFRLYHEPGLGCKRTEHGALHQGDVLALPGRGGSGGGRVPALRHLPRLFLLVRRCRFQTAARTGPESFPGHLPVFLGANAAQPAAAVRAPAQSGHADGHLPEDVMTAPSERAPGRNPVLNLVLVLCVMSVAAAVMLVVAMVTLFQFRRFYVERVAGGFSRVLLRLLGVRMIVHHDQPWPTTQTVYISNHTSVLDVFVLLALGLPNTRFFLSGFLRAIVPMGVIGYLAGTFWTVPQYRREERVRLFQRAARILRKTGNPFSSARRAFACGPERSECSTRGRFTWRVTSARRSCLFTLRCRCPRVPGRSWPTIPPWPSR